MRSARAATALAAALLVAGLSGCAAASGPPREASTSPTLPLGVEVELFQLRSDVAQRGAQIRVVNGSDEDLVVTRLSFADDWFDGEAVRERRSTIAAGRTVDLGIALPESACEEEVDAAARSSRVTLEFEAAGAAGSATVEVADPLGFTEVMHVKECLRHDLERIVTLEWSAFAGSAAPALAALTLAVTPADRGSDAEGEGPATGELVEVQTTNLLMFADTPAALPLGVDVATLDAPAEITVPLVPLRCDPHAVMEDKRGTVFNVAVALDGANGVVELPASEAMRGEILRWVADWCGFGSG